MMDDEEALKESVSNLRSAILLRRTDIIRSILSTAAECKREIFCYFGRILSRTPAQFVRFGTESGSLFLPSKGHRNS